MSRTPEYNAWINIKARCYNINNPRYASYGGRGIKVCEKWKHSFDNFLTDMGERPSDKHSIDRIDNDGDYTPENCRWATMTRQQNNKKDNTYLTHNGMTLSLADWARKVGINQVTLSARLTKRGWSVEKALSTPVKNNHGRDKKCYCSCSSKLKKAVKALEDILDEYPLPVFINDIAERALKEIWDDE